MDEFLSDSVLLGFSPTDCSSVNILLVRRRARYTGGAAIPPSMVHQ